MSLIRTGFAASVPFLCGFVGSLLAGWLSDWSRAAAVRRS